MFNEGTSVWSFQSQRYSIKVLSTELRHVWGTFKSSICSRNMIENPGDHTEGEEKIPKCTHLSVLDASSGYYNQPPVQ